MLAAVCMFGITGLALAATAANLATSDNFAVLAGSTITNTGSTVVNGDLGLSPGSSVTGFPPGTINGIQYIAESVAAQAQLDLVTAYNVLVAQSSSAMIATELGGATVNSGVYDSADGTFAITGTLTLDAQNNPDAVFIFKTSSTLITADSSIVNLLNGAQACNVFWQVGSSVTLGTNSTFKGNILAMASATITTGANVEGRVLTRDGAVTLDTSTITKPSCAVAPVIVAPVNSGGGAPTGVFTPNVTSTGTSSISEPEIVEVIVLSEIEEEEEEIVESTGPTFTGFEDLITPTVKISTTDTSSPRLPNTGFDPN